MRTAIFLFLALLSVDPSLGNHPPAQPTVEFLSLPSYSLRELGTAENREIQVGDSLIFEVVGLHADYPEVNDWSSFRLDVPEGSSSLFELGWSAKLKKAENQIELHAYPLKGGSLTFPSLVLFQGPDGTDESGDQEKAVGRVESIQIDVKSSLAREEVSPGSSEEGSEKAADSDQPIELFPPVGLPFPILIASMVGFAILALVALIVFLLMRASRKKHGLPEMPVVQKPKLPEHLVAFNELDQLEKQALWKQRQFKPHYFGVSEILKAYLGERYGVDAKEATSGELVQMLERQYIEESMIKEVETLYSVLDIVKFTDTEPRDGESEQVLKRARTIVEKTKRHPQVEANNESPKQKTGEVEQNAV